MHCQRHNQTGELFYFIFFLAFLLTLKFGFEPFDVNIVMEMEVGSREKDTVEGKKETFSLHAWPRLVHPRQATPRPANFLSLSFSTSTYVAELLSCFHLLVWVFLEICFCSYLLA